MNVQEYVKKLLEVTGILIRLKSQRTSICIEEEDEYVTIRVEWSFGNATYSDCVLIHHDPQEGDIDQATSYLLKMEETAAKLKGDNR